MNSCVNLLFSSETMPCPTFMVGFFLPFVKSIKVFDEKYFVSRNPNKEIVFFRTKVSCKKEYTKLTPYVENF